MKFIKLTQIANEQLKTAVNEEQTYILLSNSGKTRFLAGSGSDKEAAGLILELLVRKPNIFEELNKLMTRQNEFLPKQELQRIIGEINFN